MQSLLDTLFTALYKHLKLKVMFKRIYIEISDYCNLQCSFCTSPRRNSNRLSVEEFEIILSRIKGHTKEIYLHVLGEPLIHPSIDRMLELATKDFKVCMTTNARLISVKQEVLLKSYLHKINISLNSAFNLGSEELKGYLDEVIAFTKKSILTNDTAINLRLWAYDSENTKLEFIENYLSKAFDHAIIRGNLNRITKGLIITYDKEFEWPSLQNEPNDGLGNCLGGKTHLAILANGEVAICCLDTLADSALGNIFNNTLEEIMSSPNFKKAIKGFNDNKLVLDICRHCSYCRR